MAPGSQSGQRIELFSDKIGRMVDDGMADEKVGELGRRRE